MRDDFKEQISCRKERKDIVRGMVPNLCDVSSNLSGVRVFPYKRSANRPRRVVPPKHHRWRPVIITTHPAIGMATGAGVPVGDVGGPHTPPTHALPVGHNDLTRERKISSLADIGPKDHAIERRALIPGPPAGGPHSPPADKMLQ